MKIVLASASPRRRELLSMVCKDFSVRISNTNESYNGEAVDEWIRTLAKNKAYGVCASDDEIVIGCDTVVVNGGKILGKPRDRAEAISMLKSMSNASHEVITGVCVKRGDFYCTDAVVTTVHMRELSLSEIEKYVDTCAPYDKAGAYGIQEMAGAFVTRIEGDYFNIVGLPLCRLTEIFKEQFGVSLI